LESSQIIHIGYPKTASTWLQNNFFNNISNIDFVDRRTTKEDFILSNSLDFDSNFLTDKYKNKSRILLSHELLVGGMIHTGGVNGILIKEFCLRLKSVFPNAQIVLFIRNQTDMIASAYNQYIKGGGTYGINKYLYQNTFDALNKYFFFSFKYLEYDKIIDLYKKEFGENNVYIYLHEEFSKDPKEFTKKLSEKFNFDTDFDKIDYTPLNIKYRKHLKTLFRITNIFYRKSVINKFNLFRFNKLYYKSKNTFNSLNKYKIFGSFQNTREILKEKNYKYICDYYKESNQRLISKHKLNEIKEYNYPL